MRIKSLTTYILFMILISCTSSEQIKKADYPEKSEASEIGESVESSIKAKDYNFKFIGFDINIDDPAWDRRSYYKIYIDKVETGRTTIGLESQKKVFESKISSNNRHLLIVEKWALDEKKGQYVKLNNIEQPKPDFVYFDLPADKVAIITLKNDPFKNKSEFEVELD
jgi:hypothetical protein